MYQSCQKNAFNQSQYLSTKLKEILTSLKSQQNEFQAKYLKRYEQFRKEIDEKDQLIHQMANEYHHIQSQNKRLRLQNLQKSSLIKYLKKMHEQNQNILSKKLSIIAYLQSKNQQLNEKLFELKKFFQSASIKTKQDPRTLNRRSRHEGSEHFFIDAISMQDQNQSNEPHFSNSSSLLTQKKCRPSLLSSTQQEKTKTKMLITEESPQRRNHYLNTRDHNTRESSQTQKINKVKSMESFFNLNDYQMPSNAKYESFKEKRPSKLQKVKNKRISYNEQLPYNDHRRNQV